MKIFETPKEHPLKSEVRRQGLRLYQVAPVLGVSEATVSRWLNGIQEMPKPVEEALRRALAEDKEGYR